MSPETLYDVLQNLYSRLICLGLNCNYIGESSVLLANTDEDTAWPSCTNPNSDFKGYVGSNPDALLEWMKVDLDVRTIGTLIEMDAATAAYDVYHWGRHSRSHNDESNIALQDIAMSPELSEPDNMVGAAFDTYFSGTGYAGSTFADTHEYSSMLGLKDFVDATLRQRRIITESSLVTITLHIAAMDLLHKAIKNCNEGDTSSLGDDEGERRLKYGAHHWDRAFAYLSGWAEETDDAQGFLMMDIARFLCKAKPGSCNATTGDSEVNRLLIEAFLDGKEQLEGAGCAGAETRRGEIEKLILTVLVDAVAHFADKIALDTTDATQLAEGCEL